MRATKEQLSDLVFNLTQAVAGSVARYMEAVSAVLGAEDAAIVAINACLGAAVGVYKTWSVATGQPFKPDYLRQSLDRALAAKFMIAESKPDGSFGDFQPLQ